MLSPTPQLQRRWLNGGPRCRSGLWRGTTPTVVRLSFGAGLHFLFLDSLRGVLESRRPDGKLSSGDAFVAGGLSRAGSAVIMCPITVIKTRMEYGGAGGTQYKAPSSNLPPTLVMNVIFDNMHDALKS